METDRIRSAVSDAVLDGIAAALFAVFVGLLLLGYFDPDLPYSGLATLPLLGSLASLFWVNRRSSLVPH
jgi:hypothetical protein